tara:strand:+ start:210 stop:905 length:696 start_codon:yes stop_codon:yes gene_type:complete
MKHFVHIDKCLHKLAGVKVTEYPVCEELNDMLIDSGNHINSDYADDDSLEQAQSYIIEQGYQANEIDQEVLKSEVVQAMAQAYEDEVSSGAYNDILEHVQDQAGEINCKYYFVDAKGNKCEFYEAEYARFYMTRKQFLQDDNTLYYKDDYDSKKEWLEDCESTLDLIVDGETSPYNWTHFDYHGQRFDCDKWFEMFKEYQEITSTIDSERKAKQSQVKAYIKNNVPLLKRA